MRSYHWQTCRLCHDYGPQDGMVRYGTRHWTHVRCAALRWGWKALLSKLSTDDCYHAGRIAFEVQREFAKAGDR